MPSDFVRSVRDPQEWVDACAQRQATARAFRGPWLTWAMLMGFCVVYYLEFRLAVLPGSGWEPRPETLVAMGGLNRHLVQSGEWYRVLTAAFLHGNLTHLAGNAVAFVFAAYALEWLVGRAWMFCIFMIGAVAGSLVSMYLAPPGMVGVGASGAIMALLAALLTLGLRLPRGRVRTWALVNVVRSIIPALIPGNGLATLRIDYGAHLGGAVAGAAIGLLVWLVWRRDQPEPPLRGVAGLVAVVGLLALVASVWMAAQNYPQVPSLTEFGASPLHR